MAARCVVARAAQQKTGKTRDAIGDVRDESILGSSRSRSRDRRRKQYSDEEDSQEKVDPIAMNFNNFDRSSKEFFRT